MLTDFAVGLNTNGLFIRPEVLVDFLASTEAISITTKYVQ